MKKDVLFLCQFFYPEYITSATLPFDTAKKISEAGFSVDVLTGFPKEFINDKGKKILKKETFNNINIRRIKYLQLKRIKKLGRLINYFSFTFAVFLNLFKLRKYKLIIVYSNPPLVPYIAYLANKFFKTKIIFVSYDVYPEMAVNTNSIKAQSFIAKRMSKINKKLFPALSSAVVLSEDMKEFILKNRKIEEKKVKIIPNWHNKIEETVFSNLDYSNFATLKDEKRKIISYLGNLGICQDVDTVIELLKHYKNSEEVVFVFAGHGNKMYLIKELIAKEDIKNVHMFGFLLGNDYYALLKLSYAFMLTLHNELIGQASPSKMYSYLAAGKPIISIVNNKGKYGKNLEKMGVGLNSTPGDLAGLIGNLEKLLKNKEIYLQMKKNTTKVFNNNYETNIATEQYVKLVKETLEVSNV